MAEKLIADGSDDLWGQITPPGPFVGDPKQELGQLIGFGVRIITIVAGLTLLIYLMWGGLNWIMAGDDKEKLSKAQQKLTNAIIGILVLFAVIGLWGFVTGDILGIITRTPEGGWVFHLPSL